MMLLPSAMSCDSMAHPQPTRPQRPKLYSFERYMPQRSQSPVLGLIASCRALHNIIGEALSPTPSPSLDTTMRMGSMQNPFGQAPASSNRPAAPRGANKRDREEFDEDEHKPSYTFHNQDSRVTPKRRRVVPLELPPGLKASDFEALSVNSILPQTQSNRPVPMQIDMPPESNSSHLPDTDMAWTDADDRLLVETVLSKMNFSSLEWNECARKLGKDKDSLGERWRMLLCEGNVGLRRGSGRSARPDLDIPSW